MSSFQHLEERKDDINPDSTDEDADTPTFFFSKREL
jgi:hypothetical protein